MVDLEQAGEGEAGLLRVHKVQADTKALIFASMVGHQNRYFRRDKIQLFQGDRQTSKHGPNGGYENRW